MVKVTKVKFAEEKQEDNIFFDVAHQIKALSSPSKEVKISSEQELKWINKRFRKLCEKIRTCKNKRGIRKIKKHVLSDIEETKSKIKLYFYTNFLKKIKNKLHAKSLVNVKDLQAKLRCYHYSLEKMPVEIITHIFSFLTPKTLCLTSQSNKNIQEIANSDLLWRRHYTALNQSTTKQKSGFKQLFRDEFPTAGFRKLYRETMLPNADSITEFPINCKFVVAGIRGSGTQSLALKYAANFFSEVTGIVCQEIIKNKNLGMDVFTKTLLIEDLPVKNVIYLYRPLDNFSCISYSLRGARALFLVIDLCNMKTYEPVKNIIGFCQNMMLTYSQIVLVGSKNDLKGKHQVTHEDIIELANKARIPYYFTSAKTGEGVMEAFINTLKHAILMIQTEAMKKPEEPADPDRNKLTKRKKCLVM